MNKFFSGTFLEHNWSFCKIESALLMQLSTVENMDQTHPRVKKISTIVGWIIPHIQLNSSWGFFITKDFYCTWVLVFWTRFLLQKVWKMRYCHQCFLAIKTRPNDLGQRKNTKQDHLNDHWKATKHHKYAIKTMKRPCKARIGPTRPW